MFFYTGENCFEPFQAKVKRGGYYTLPPEKSFLIRFCILSKYCLLMEATYWFYGISTTVGNLMPNSFNIYIKIYMISKHVLSITSLNEPEFLCSTYSFHLCLSNTNISIYFNYFFADSLMFSSTST